MQSSLSGVAWSRPTAGNSDRRNAFMENIVFKTPEEAQASMLKDQKVLFICQDCGRPGYYRWLSSLKTSKRFRCRSCSGKYARSKVDISKIDFKAVAQRTKQHNLEKYGVASPMQLQSMKNKIKQQNIEKYGCHPSQLQSVKDKQAQTNLEKYGCKAASQSEQVKQTFRDNCEKKYGEGVINPFQATEVKEKIKQTWIAKYGVNNPQKAKAIRRKAEQTCLECYGATCNWANHDNRLKCQQAYTYEDINFDSSYELMYFIYLQDHNINFTYEPDEFFVFAFNGKEHRYFPDFKVGSQFIEIKGEQFVKEDGTWQNPYDHSQDGLYEAKRQCLLKNNVKIIFQSSNEMQSIVDYIKQTYTLDYPKLFKNDLVFPYPNSNLIDTYDDALIQHFHKSIYEANRKGYLSPVNAWLDKSLIKKSALNRLKEVKSCTPKDVLRGFSVAKIAPKVSVFKASLAKKLVKDYLSNCDSVVDPFSGFSGRMLGAAANGKTYVGKDLNEKHTLESNEIISYKQLQNCSVTVEDILKKDNIEAYDALFTCPPYEDKENWNGNADVSKTCDEWIDICMQKYKCKKYLFVVDDTEKYKDYIVDIISNKSHFGENKEQILLISKEN